MSNFSRKERAHLKGLWGSLSSRVLITACVFLILPLIVQGLFNFYKNYKDEMSDLIVSLEVLGKSRAELLDQFNHLEYRFLDMTQDLLELKETDPKVTKAQLNRLLAQIKDEQNVSAIFYLEKNDAGRFICTLASNPQMLGVDYTYAIHARTLNQEHTASIGWDHKTKKGYYLVTKRVFSKETSEIQGTLDIAISNKLLLDRLSVIRGDVDPTHVAIVDPTGMVFLCTDPSLILDQLQFPGDKKAPPIKGLTKEEIQVEQVDLSIDGDHNVVSFKNGGEEQYGIFFPVEASDLRVLVYLPRLKFFHHIGKEFYTIAIFLLAVLIVGVPGTLLVTRRMAKPLQLLCEVMMRVEDGDQEARFEEQKMGFEINALGRIFNSTIASLIEHMKEAETERVGRETFERELKIGRDVQLSILPKSVPSFSGLDIASGFMSAKEVGGDFYDLFARQEEEKDLLMCTVADTAGKGISACFYSLGLRSMLRSYTADSKDLSEMLLKANNAFCHDTGETGIFVTAWVAFIDEKTKKMQYSSCGHPPGLLKRKNGEIEKLSTPGIALGAVHLDHVPVEEVSLGSGDLLLLYTDGVTEAHSLKKELFGEERLMTFLKNHPCDISQKVVDDLLIEIGKFTTGTTQFDDLTILAIRII